MSERGFPQDKGDHGDGGPEYDWRDWLLAAGIVLGTTAVLGIVTCHVLGALR